MEATAATGEGGYHSGVHGGAVEEPMQVSNNLRIVSTWERGVPMRLHDSRPISHDQA